MEKNRISKVDLIFENDGTLVNTVLDKVKKMNPDDIIMEMIDSGLKGRGGAGFPTGLKWKFTKAENSYDKYVVCNADEGEAGTFKDREILDRVPEIVFTGMAVQDMRLVQEKDICTSEQNIIFY